MIDWPCPEERERDFTTESAPTKMFEMEHHFGAVMTLVKQGPLHILLQ